MAPLAVSPFSRIDKGKRRFAPKITARAPSATPIRQLTAEAGHSSDAEVRPSMPPPTFSRGRAGSVNSTVSITRPSHPSSTRISTIVSVIESSHAVSIEIPSRPLATPNRSTGVFTAQHQTATPLSPINSIASPMMETRSIPRMLPQPTLIGLPSISTVVSSTRPHNLEHDAGLYDNQPAHPRYSTQDPTTNQSEQVHFVEGESRENQGHPQAPVTSPSDTSLTTLPINSIPNKNRNTDTEVARTKSARPDRKRKSVRVVVEGADEESAAPTSIKPPKMKRTVRKKKPDVDVFEAEENAVSTDAAESDARPSTPGRTKRKSRSRNASTSKTPRRVQRKSAEEVADEDAMAEEREHDPTQTTMSALVEDLPVGRATSTRMAVATRIEQNRARERLRRERLRAVDRGVTLGLPRNEALERGQPLDTPAPNSAALDVSDAAKDGTPPFDDEIDCFSTENRDDEEDDDWMQGLAASTFVPRIGMDEDGNVAPDELQMEIDRPSTFREENYERVFERDGDRFVNSMTHSKKHKGSTRWSQANTADFYHNLAMYGTDFESIARVMPGRTRLEIKNKFNAEDRRNPALVTEHLFAPKPIDLEEAAKRTGVDLSGPPPDIKGAPRETGLNEDPFAEDQDIGEEFNLETGLDSSVNENLTDTGADTGNSFGSSYQDAIAARESTVLTPNGTGKPVVDKLFGDDEELPRIDTVLELVSQSRATHS